MDVPFSDFRKRFFLWGKSIFRPIQRKENDMDIKKPVLLVVSFGTSHEETCKKNIGAIEEALQRAFPNYEVRRAFTAKAIIEKLRGQGVRVDSVREALDRLVNEGVREVVIQPTHIMPGTEYDMMAEDARAFYGRFDRLAIGKALLTDESDFDEMQRIIGDMCREYGDPDTAAVFMGHGTVHNANIGYAKLQRRINAAGHENIFIGTVEAMPTVHYIRALIRLGNYKRVVLTPLMIVAGDHALNDMAGDGEDSWKRIFEEDGFKVECRLAGLGECESVRRLIVRHAALAMTE